MKTLDLAAIGGRRGRGAGGQSTTTRDGEKVLDLATDKD